MGVSYKNGIKRPGSTSQYTPDQMVELMRCGKDPIYFAEKYYHIVHPVTGKMLIPLFDFQKRMILDFKNNRKNVVLSSRQIGKTTCSAIFILWYALFNEDKFIAILANQQKTAVSIIDEIKLAYEGLPDWLKPGVTDYNKLIIKFENGTEIQAGATSENAFRGQAVSLLFLDEFAFVPENLAESFWRSNYPTLSCVTKDTLLLTDNGFVEIGEYVDPEKTKGSYYEIEGLNVWGKNGLENASDLYISPKTQIKKIKTQYGLSLSATEDHPIYSINKHRMGMIKNKDLRIGDYVRVDYGMDVYGNHIKLDYCDEGIYENNRSYSLKCKFLTKDICYLLGVYIAEGWISQGNVLISNTNKQVREAFLNSKYVNFRELSESRLISDQATGRFFKYLLADIWNKKCHEKEVPSFILKTSKVNQQQFIAGYLDGYGHVTKKGDISASSTSKKLITVIQQMLLNMGIISNVFENDPDESDIGNYVLPQGKPIQSLKTAWCLSISRNFGYRLKDFGLKIPRKYNRLKDNIKNNYKNKQIKIPAFNWIVEEIRLALQRNNISARKCRLSGCRVDKLLSGKDKHITRNLFIKLVEFLDDTTLKYKFKDILENKCLFDKIIEFDYYQDDTYDLTCPETSSFLQNGILGSNTGGRVIIVSTPHGAAGKFYEIYQDAEHNPHSEFNPIKVAWDEYPGRDEAWKEKMIAEFGSIAFSQEYGCIFRESSINIRYNGIIYTVSIGDLHEQGINILPALPNAN